MEGVHAVKGVMNGPWDVAVNIDLTAVGKRLAGRRWREVGSWWSVVMPTSRTIVQYIAPWQREGDGVQ